MPIVEARFLRTKLNRKGPELSDAMLVPENNNIDELHFALPPPEKVDSLKPTLDLEER